MKRIKTKAKVYNASVFFVFSSHILRTRTSRQNKRSFENLDDRVRDMWRSGTKRLRVPFGRTVFAQTVLQMTKHMSFNTVLSKDTAHSETSVSFGNGQTTKKEQEMK